MSVNNLRAIPGEQRTNAEGKQVTNKVLLAAPDNEFDLMRADLAYVDLPSHLSLHEPAQDIKFVYFPNRGMVSQVVVTKDGSSVEVGVVGYEGYVGSGLATGLTRSSVREIIQIAGDGFRMMGNALERILRSAPQLHMLFEQACGASRNASGADRGVQSPARYPATSFAVVANDSGPSGPWNSPHYDLRFRVCSRTHAIARGNDLLAAARPSLLSVISVRVLRDCLGRPSF